VEMCEGSIAETLRQRIGEMLQAPARTGLPAAPAEQVEELLAELKAVREHVRYLIRLITAAAAADSGFSSPASPSRYKCRPKGSAPAVARNGAPPNRYRRAERPSSG
jgi:hypothetical protein